MFATFGSMLCVVSNSRRNCLIIIPQLATCKAYSISTSTSLAHRKVSLLTNQCLTVFSCQAIANCENFIFIQDSPANWHAEAGKMKDIDRNAYLVIAADVAANYHSGIFRTRERYSIRLQDETSQASQEFMTFFAEQETAKHRSFSGHGQFEWHTGGILRRSTHSPQQQPKHQQPLIQTLHYPDHGAFKCECLQQESFTSLLQKLVGNVRQQ